MNDFLDEHFKSLYAPNMREVYYDPVKFKLYVSESILKQIPNNVPLKNDIESLVLEQNIESFLFFLSSAQDIVLQEINSVLKITKDKKNKREFFSKLSKCENPKGKLISQELDKSFNKPVMKFRRISGEELKRIFPLETDSLVFGLKKRDDGFFDLPYWDSETSWRWEINKLRNEVAHNTVLKRLPMQGLVEKTTLFFLVNDDDYSSINRYEIKNPLEYFTNAFIKMKDLLFKIRQILNDPTL